MIVSIHTHRLKENMVDPWLDQWIREIYPRVMSLHGLISGHVLADREENQIIQFLMWDSEQAAINAIQNNEETRKWRQSLEHFNAAPIVFQILNEEISFGYIGLCAGAGAAVPAGAAH